MILYLKTFGSLFAQRKEVYIVACFFATVLFNTTYMSLGTYVPMVLILLGFCFLNKKNRAIQNKSSIMYVLLSVLILFATVVSGGDDFRTPFKIIVTALFTYFACMESYSNDEAKFFSLIICLSYCHISCCIPLSAHTLYLQRRSKNMPLIILQQPA